MKTNSLFLMTAKVSDNKNFIGLALCLSMITLICSCRKDSPDLLVPLSYEKYNPVPCIDSVSFSQEIKPELMDNYCNTSGCHDSQTAAGGIDLSNHEQIALNTHKSWFAMEHDTGYIPMPSPYIRIPDSLFQKFHCWIQQGKPNN